jgi:hypothetical protein
MADPSEPSDPKPLRNDWGKVRQRQETIKKQVEFNKELRKRAEEVRKFQESVNSTFPRKDSAVTQPDKAEQGSEPFEWPAPGSLYNALRAIGEVGYRMSLALSPTQEKPTDKAQMQQIQAEPDVVRSPAMVDFFATRDRYFGHLAWIGKALFSWPAVLLIAATAEACGVAAMQMDQYVIAIVFSFAAICVVAIKAIASNNDRERSFLIALLAILCFAGHIAWIMYTHAQFTKRAIQDTQISELAELLKGQDQYRPERLLEKYPNGYVIYEINYSNKVFPYGKQRLEDFEINWEPTQIVGVSDQFVDIQLPDISNADLGLVFYGNMAQVPKRVGGTVNMIGIGPLSETVELVAIRETGFVFLIGFRAPGS